MKNVNEKSLPWYRDKKLFAGILIAVTLAFLLTSFVGFPTTVNGSSMSPTYKHGDNIIVYKIYSSIDRYDVIAINADKPLIKRVIGLPNETVKIINGKVYINGKVLKDDVISEDIQDEGIAFVAVTLKEDEYFVLGDNRNNSDDSRKYGPFSEDTILGKVAFSK